jgi:hypothetical protein
MSRPLQSSLHLATTVRLCVHALADREAFAPQDLPSLFVALDLVSGPGRRLPLSAGSELPAVAQRLDVAAGSATAAGLGSPPRSIKGRRKFLAPVADLPAQQR